jgi:hypothetical protein
MTQPTQDPWGNNQQPPNPPQPAPQPYVFPQPGYGPQPQPPVYPQQQPPPPVYYQQPGYPQQPQQQPGLWNPSGVYGGVTVKKSRMPVWGWVLVVVAALVIISGVASTNKSTTSTTTNSVQVVATAGSSEPQHTTASNVAPSVVSSNIGKIGQTVSKNGYLVTVNGVDTSLNFSGADYGKAKDGYAFIAIDITVGSTKDKGVSSNGLSCSLKDDKGFDFDETIIGYKKPLLPGENDIPSGGKARGWVTFEVPQNAAGLILEYKELFGGSIARIALS